MNDAIETVNLFIAQLVETLLPTFNTALPAGAKLYTGDERDPQVALVKPPSVEIFWLGEQPGLKPESCGAMVQLTIRTPDKLRRKCDQAADTLTAGIGLKTKAPIVTIPLKNFAAGLPGVDVGTEIILYRLRRSRMNGEEQEERINVLDFVVDYVP